MNHRLRVRVSERPVVSTAGIAHALAAHFAIVDSGAAVEVIDLNTVDGEIDSLVRELRSRPSSPKVLVLSSRLGRDVVAAAIRAGADGFLASLSDWRELAAAIERLASGQVVYGPEVAQAFASADPDDLEVIDAAFWEVESAHLRETKDDPAACGAALPLSPREQQILRMVATGRSSQSIANTLVISVPTVRKHRENLMRKLGLHNVAEVTAFALRQELIGEDLNTIQQRAQRRQA